MRHERTLLATAFLLGALLRLPGIDATPLRPDEASQAWRAAQAASQGQVAADGACPINQRTCRAFREQDGRAGAIQNLRHADR